MPHPTLRVLLIEQEPESISQVQSLFSEIKETDLEIISSDNLLSYVSQKQIDLILLSHEEKGADLVTRIRSRYPYTFIIVLLPSVNEKWIDDYIKAGVNGLAYKDRNYLSDLSQEIKKALIQIVKRKSFLIRSVSSASFFSEGKDLYSVLRDMSAFEPGQKILHYRIIEEVAEGGMGQVYSANDLRLGRKVAIKVLPPRVMKNESAKRRLIREARAASGLNHPNIITIYSIEETPEVSFIVMEYVDGESLSRMIQRGPVDLQWLIDIGVETALALSAAHDAGLIHRDIKPANIMVTTHGHAKLLDFGLAKRSPSTGENISDTSSSGNITAAGFPIGTLAYMSPEQARAEELDSRTDIFSLGAVLYHAATAKLPFEGSTALALIHEVVKKEPTAPSQLQTSLPRLFDEIIARSMAKKITDRYPSALEFAEELRKLKAVYSQSSSNRLSSRDTVLAETRKFPNEIPKWVRQHKPIAALLIGMLLSAVFLSILAVYHRWPPRFTRGQNTSDKIFVIVVPFENQTGRAELNYVRQGLSSELALLLSQEPEFVFIPFSGMKALLDKGLTQTEAARRAHADYLVKGVLRNTNSGMALSYSLIHVKSKMQFTDSFPLSASDFLGGLNHIQAQLLSWLKLRPIHSPLTMNPRAFGLNLYAFSKIHEMEEGKEESFGEAKALLQRALEIEPSAEIYHGLAYLHYQAINLGIDFNPENHELCRYYLDRGLALRPDYVPLIDVKTRYEFYMGRPERTLQIATDQIKANRLSLELIGMIGMSFRHSGDYPTSERFFKYALQLSPEHYYIKLNYNACLFQSGKRQAALNELRELNVEYPERYWGKYYLAWYSLLMGRIDEGRKLTRELPDTLPTRILKYQAGLTPDESTDFEPVKKMLEAAEVDFHFSFRLAQCYALSGKTDKALQYLQKTTDKGWIAWNYFDWDPMLANLRATESYRAMRSEGLALQKSTIERERKLVQPAIVKLGLQ